MTFIFVIHLVFNNENEKKCCDCFFIDIDSTKKKYKNLTTKDIISHITCWPNRISMTNFQVLQKGFNKDNGTF